MKITQIYPNELKIYNILKIYLFSLIGGRLYSESLEKYKDAYFWVTFGHFWRKQHFFGGSCVLSKSLVAPN